MTDDAPSSGRPDILSSMHKTDPRALSAISLTGPVAVGYIPLGLIFGLLFVQAGAAPWLALLSSAIIYAGAAQFMMVPMLAAGLPVTAILFATLIINLRHVFYGLSLLHAMPASTWWQRWYVIFALTDETWSLLVSLPESARARHMALISALNHLWWVLGTALGALLGTRLEPGLDGLDFALAALFAVLAVEQWRARKDFVPVWTAMAAYALALWLAPEHALTVAIALSVAAALVRPEHRAEAGRA